MLIKSDAQKYRDYFVQKYLEKYETFVRMYEVIKYDTHFYYIISNFAFLLARFPNYNNK